MPRRKLADAIIKVLKSSGRLLTTNEIHAQLDLNRSVTKLDINSVLYGELSSAGLVQNDSLLRWRFVGEQSSGPSTRSNTPMATRPKPRLAADDSRPNRQHAAVDNGLQQIFQSIHAGEQPSLLSAAEADSIEAAVLEEILAASKSVKSTWLDIDAIEHLEGAPGKFVYRLVLSTPVNLGADQAITFHVQSPKDTISAIVVHCHDDGLVVECEKPLPTDARLLNLSFDPAFILRALKEFVLELAPQGGAVASRVFSKNLPPTPSVQSIHREGLNEDQARAIDEMSATPVHLLWGPPGTGKTTTVGAAIVEWMRKKKRVLIVSTSNAAVDVAMRAILKRSAATERRQLLRLGTSLDPRVREVTVAGKLAIRHRSLAADTQAALRKLQNIQQQLASRTLSHERLHSLLAEAREYEKQISDFNEMVTADTPQLESDALVVGCTLAKMVLDRNLRSQRFDVVIVDEASMAPLLYAFAASLLASSHLVYAGDPKQLPPIVQSDGRNAAKWFGQNVYDWFGMENSENVAATKLSLLRTQYRMTNQIGGVVSRLMYGGKLRHGRNASGPCVEFVDISKEWQTTYYSVSEKSYYHLAAVPVLHALSDLISHDELLLLSPFRPQRSLLAALAFDLQSRSSTDRRTLASTIHRAQGSEARAVVVDLTTHSPQQLVAFFRDKHCAKLFNVAISRARDHLVILGCQSMLRELAKVMPFWKRVIDEFGAGIDVISCDEVIEDLDTYHDLTAIPISGTGSLPALYCHSFPSGAAAPGIAMLQGVQASRKLLVLSDPATPGSDGEYIVRTSTDCPPVFIGGGHVCLPYQGRWIAVESPNVSRVLWRIGFSHLADDEVDPAQAKRFFCPKCSNGELVLQQFRGEGWYLVCTNGQAHECYHRRRLSLEDAKLKVRLQGMRCPQGHPLTARSGSRGIFLGCENYPACDFAESLSILRGV